jgi:hypothetical protein
MELIATGVIIFFGVIFISKNLGTLHSSLKDINNKETD